MTNRKGTQEPIMIYNHYLKTEQHEPVLKYGGEIRWSERVRKSLPTSDTSRGKLAKTLAKI